MVGNEAIAARPTGGIGKNEAIAAGRHPKNAKSNPRLSGWKRSYGLARVLQHDPEIGVVAIAWLAQCLSRATRERGGRRVTPQGLLLTTTLRHVNFCIENPLRDVDASGTIEW